MALLKVAASRLWRKSKLWKGSSRAMAQSVGITASALHVAERNIIVSLRNESHHL